MRVHSKILISIILLTLFISANVQAKEKGTIKTFTGKTYFDVSYVIYEDLQEIHFNTSYGDRGIIAFNDILFLYDEDGNDITSFIRPHLVRPRHIIDGPNNDPDDLSLGEVLKPRFYLSLSYNRMNGDFLIDANDEKLADGSISAAGIKIGVLIHVFRRIDFNINGTYSGLGADNYRENLGTEIVNYSFGIRFLLGGDVLNKLKTRFYLRAGMGWFTMSGTDNLLQYDKLQTSNIGLGAIYGVSYKVGLDFNLMYNSVYDKNISFKSDFGRIISFNLGLNYRL